MKTQNRFALRLILALTVIFGGGWILGGVLNLAAIVSPQLVSMIQCPAGATAKQNMSQQSFDMPGQKTMTFQCVDTAGNSVTPLTDSESRAIEYRIFYPAGVIVMALVVAAWFIRSVLRGDSAGRQRASAS